jgi:LPXTG-site transpeptidase (sortase) family protein
MKKKKKQLDVLEKVLLPSLLAAFFVSICLFWNNISWVANGDVWRQMLSDAFPRYFPKPYVLVKKTATNSPAVAGKTASTTIPKPGAGVTTPATGTVPVAVKPREDIITIPKIGVSAPIVTAQTSNNDVIHGLLDSGVVLYPGSTPFGQTGQTVILGHSAPPGWPIIKYDWVFSRINELKAGDTVVITYNNETRYYKVVKTRIVAPQEGVPDPTVAGNSLMLVSCWPPGKDLKRITVEATTIN